MVEIWTTRRGGVSSARASWLGITGLAAISVWGAGCQQGVHDASDDLRRSAAGETTTPYSIVSTTQPTRIDDGCAMRFTVAADTPVVLGVNVDGAPVNFHADGWVMVPDVNEVNAQCEVGPPFGTDDLQAMVPGNEENGDSFFFIGTIEPTTIPAAALAPQAAVVLNFDAPHNFRVLLLASTSSMLEELIIEAPAEVTP